MCHIMCVTGETIVCCVCSWCDKPLTIVRCVCSWCDKPAQNHYS